MNQTKLGKVFNIEVTLHYTWYIVFALLAWSLAVDFFPSEYPGLTKAGYWIIGVVSSLFLFASVLFHELSHSIIAKINKIHVDKITLFFFGGVASIGEQNITPAREFKMAIAGPLASVFLASIFFLAGKLTGIVYIIAICSYLSRINLILALFNMIPAYPLDGGRVFRALLWHYFKDIKKATYIASKGGKIFAVLFVIFGITSLFLGGGGLWFIFLGIFLYFIAGLSYDQLVINKTLKNIKVKDVMMKNFKTISPRLSFKALFPSYFLKYNQGIIPVKKQNEIIGVVSFSSIQKIPKEYYPQLKIMDVTIPLNKLRTLHPDESAYNAFVKMMQSRTDELPVLENNNIVGIIKKSALMKISGLA